MGLEVRLLEAREAFDETGAGLQLGPHAVKVLDRLGLSQPLAQLAFAPEAIVVRSARGGRQIVRIPLGAHARARYGAPYWCLHRQDLHRALCRAVAAEGRIRVDFGFRVTSVQARGDGVCASDPAGRAAEGSALIGADGLWSTVRHAVDPQRHGLHRPRHSGWTAWRAVLPMDRCPSEIERATVGLWLGADAHVVCYPIRNGELMNIVIVLPERFEAEGFDHRGDPAVLDAALARWPDAVRCLAQRAGLEWQRWSLYMRPGRAPWSMDRVLLAGDAAHPVLPFLAQGAALALEDAWCIATHASRIGDLPKAWQAVEASRRARAQDVARASQRNAWAYHLGGISGHGRNWALRCIGGRRLLSAYDWLYAHDETVEQPAG